jgi:hypothetical protein
MCGIVSFAQSPFSKHTLSTTIHLDVRPLADPYISFNKLFGCKNLNEYNEYYGVHISYDMGFGWEELPDGFLEVKFCTRWQYPIQAIVQALKLCKSELVWYACEENHCYISRFQWTDFGVQEYILPLDDDYWDWDSENKNQAQNCIEEKDYNDSVWDFILLSQKRWRVWSGSDDFSRYRNTSVVYVEKPGNL